MKWNSNDTGRNGSLKILYALFFCIYVLYALVFMQRPGNFLIHLLYVTGQTGKSEIHSPHIHVLQTH